MTQTDTKTRITGFGFYLDEIEGEATTMKDAVAIVLEKYGGRKEPING